MLPIMSKTKLFLTTPIFVYYIYVCDDDNSKEKAEVELNISSYLEVSTNYIFFKRAILPLFETAFLQW